MRLEKGLSMLCKHPERQLDRLQGDDAAQVEICKLLGALALEDEVAAHIAAYKGPAEKDEAPDLLLAAFGNLFDSPSPRVLIEACKCLEIFAPLHKVPICHAKLVQRLITLTHSEDMAVSVAGGQVLRALSMTVGGGRSMERR